MAPEAGPFVEVPIRSWPELARFFARDLERAGLFIPMPALLPLGSSLTLTVRAPDGERLDLAMAVAGHRGTAEGRRAVVQVRLRPFTAEQRATVARWRARAEQPDTATPAASRERASLAPVADTGAVSEVTASLRETLTRLQAGAPLQSLGLPENADLAALDARYRQLVERHHPHHFARFGAPEVKRLATQVFVAIQKHYRAARQSAAHPLDGGQRAHGGRTRRAISQALQFLSLSQYDQARAALEAALQAAPDNPQLLATLHLVEGRRARAGGRLDDAHEAYARVLTLEPGHAEARLSLEEIEVKRSQQGGLLKRLLRGSGT